MRVCLLMIGKMLMSVDDHMRLLTLLLLFWSTDAWTSDWLCTEESSQRSGNEVQSCGVGIAATEDQARIKAFDNARIEFNRICQASDDCRGHQVSVKPRRTSCAANDQGIKCYRLLEFTINQDRPNPPQVKSTPASSQTPLDAFWAKWNAKYLSN